MKMIDMKMSSTSVTYLHNNLEGFVVAATLIWLDTIVPYVE